MARPSAYQSFLYWRTYKSRHKPTKKVYIVRDTPLGNTTTRRPPPPPPPPIPVSIPESVQSEAS